MLPLNAPITALGPIARRLAPKLAALGLKTIEDLLFYFPFRWEDWSTVVPITSLAPGMTATVRGRVASIELTRTPWRRRLIVEAKIQDEKGAAVSAIWFNSSFLLRALARGARVMISGRIERTDRGLQFVHPTWEKIAARAPTHTGRLVPIYHLTGSLTQKQIRTLIAMALKNTGLIPDFLPSSIITSAKLIPLDSATRAIHFPKDWTSKNEAENRLKFDELFLLQLRGSLARKEISSQKGQAIPFNEPLTRAFVKSLPFRLTQAQRRAAWEILKDLEKPTPMNRLLEGDVGSGKTVVSAIAALNVINAGFQVAYLAPTAILAAQQFETFCKLFTYPPLNSATLALITQGDIRLKTQNLKLKTQNYGKISKSELKTLLEAGAIDLAIGTHALLSEHIHLPKLALLIVDEQHRFGVRQRHALLTRGLTRMNTQIYADQENLLHKDLTYQICGAAFDITNSLGLGLKENVYQQALEEAFKQKGLTYDREKTIRITFNDKNVGTFKPDFIIDDKVIVELKALPFIGTIEKRQLWTYLKGSAYKVALLINFGSDKLEIQRVVYDTARGKNIQNQRSSASYLRESALVPHLLSMTATPIPRSLALVAYGDLDVSILNEKPQGRAAITTKVIRPEHRQAAYDLIHAEIAKGRQAFIICPLIDPSDRLGVKSVTAEIKRLQVEHFPEHNLSLLHGRMGPKQKDQIMREFVEGQAHVLVSTPVIEVGIDVPNATIIMIEGAERFGLAQLHQLRGRVGRAEFPSWCLLATDTDSETALKRLQAVVESNDGFKLAEKDLEMRGPGEIYGTVQAGFLDELKIAKLTDTILLKQSKEAVDRLLQEDPALTRYPAIKTKLAKFEQAIHFE